METKTPPNTPGFNRKPKRKSKRNTRIGKSAKAKKMAAKSNDDNAQRAVCCFLLMCAAEMLAPVFPDERGIIPTAK